jgi:hypothetical protein
MRRRSASRAHRVYYLGTREKEGRTMTKKILIALMAMFMLTAAKCKDGLPQDLTFDSPKCGSVTSFTVSYFRYGDGAMNIISLSDVREGAVFVIALDPRDSFKDATVKVEGVGAEASWINGEDNYNGLPKGTYPKKGMLEVGCAPAAEDPPKEFKYMITVENTAIGVTNTLDPRARVVSLGLD